MTTNTISLSLLKLSLGPDIIDIHNNIIQLPLDNPVHILWTSAKNVNIDGILISYIKNNWPKYTDQTVADLFDQAVDVFVQIKEQHCTHP